MTRSPRVMVLDGDYTHTLSIHAELKHRLGAHILSVASSAQSPGHLSRHTDERLIAPPPGDATYHQQLLSLAERFTPDIVIPVGHAATAQLLEVAAQLAEGVRVLTPERAQFDIASSKSQTYGVARELGIRVPEEYAVGDRNGRPGHAPPNFPMFAKARYERGGVSTALIRSRDDLEAFDPSSLGGDVLYQEYIPGSRTYAHCGYYEGGEPMVAYQHVETRSVPRRGGSGTRVHSSSIPDLALTANRLLAHLEWNGVAQVEFKRLDDGSFVLMEINPKFWASYALADRCGCPVASVAVALRLGRDQGQDLAASPPREASVVFPFRELTHALRHWRTESLLASARAMAWPPARPDFDLRDVRAHVPRRHR